MKIEKHAPLFVRKPAGKSELKMQPELHGRPENRKRKNTWCSGDLFDRTNIGDDLCTERKYTTAPHSLNESVTSARENDNLTIDDVTNSK